MSQDKPLKRSRKPRKRLSGVQIAVRFLVLVVIVALLATTAALVTNALRSEDGTSLVPIRVPDNANLNPVEAVGLSVYLNLNQDALNTPAGTDDSAIVFTIEPGESAGQIADNLLAQGLISDVTLFKNYLRFYGLDVQLEAGTYELASSMTIPEIGLALTDAAAPEITVRIPEGWRREQIADWIDNQPDIPFTGADFLAATAPGVPLPPEMVYPTDIPAGASLEGFLFPDTYRIAIDATASDLVARLLLTYESKITQQMRIDAAAQGMSMIDVLTVAGIVEREAAVADERPTVASVYLNRIAIGMKLEADPTVQYAMGYQTDTGQWWNLNLTQADYYSVDSPYNTYLYDGLPPGPIASPSLSSIMAVIYPAETPYLFFRAACDDSGRHNFAVTFEEHVSNACP